MNNIQSLKDFLQDSKHLINYIDIERINLNDSDFCSTIYDYVKEKKIQEEKIQEEHIPHRM